jgi:Immunity protein Imm1
MNKYVYFDEYHGNFWPGLDQLRPYFQDPDGRAWFSQTGNDTCSIRLQGLEGTEDKLFGRGRKDIALQMWGIPGVGVLVIYDKIGPVGFRGTYSSKGDMTRLSELVESLHSTPLPVGLFIAFDKAWLAVKEFMETEGQLPKSIEWVRNADLPPNTFPDP